MYPTVSSRKMMYKATVFVPPSKCPIQLGYSTCIPHGMLDVLCMFMYSSTVHGMSKTAELHVGLSTDFWCHCVQPTICHLHLPLL